MRNIRINQSEKSLVELKVIDAAENVTVCDPLAIIKHRQTGKPVTNTFNNIPYVQSKITLKNRNPGLKLMQFYVNGEFNEIKDLANDAERTIDVSNSMELGNSNIISFVSKGKPGTTATVVISD